MSTNRFELNDDTTTPTGAPIVVDESVVERPVEVVLERDGQESRYAMFHAHRITAEGAFLGSALLLELGEEVALSLPLGDSDTVRTTARIVALDVGPTPGIHVHFSALDESAKTRIQEHFTRGPESPIEES
jgi:hypothetical protein